tara:strand:- start:49 stop:993 length:945 start_codon:yes stop_codon:yes gene_type:complete
MEIETTKIFNKAKEWIGRSMIERFYQKLARKLGATFHLYRGNDWWFDGLTIPYLKIDRGLPKTLIHLHGFTDRKESFLPTAEHLLESFNIILPDMPGFGKTYKCPSLFYSLDNYAHWLKEFITNTVYSPVWLSGNSLGGATASRIAFDRPDFIELCIPINPAFYYNPGPNPLYEEYVKDDFLFVMNDKKDYERYLERVFHKEIKPIPFMTNAAMTESIRNRFWYQYVARQNTKDIEMDLEKLSKTDFFLNRRLKDTKTPFHFIWGENDSLFLWETVKHLKDIQPNIDYSIIKQCGHAPHLEKSKQLAEKINRLI